MGAISANAAAVATGDLSPRNLIGTVLPATGVLWFVVAVVGQWAFFYYIVAFYGQSAVTGNFEIWNRLEALGRTPYIAGDTMGNLTYLFHALGAGIIAFGGALQLIPWIRNNMPRFHHWNGRVFLVTVTGLSLSGFYLVWVRGTSPTFIDGLSTTLNGILILTFAALTLRNAMARNIVVHRRWALRLYLVSNAQWFVRVGLFGYFAINQMLGIQIAEGDLFLRLWAFGCYLVPLAVLQLYFMANDSRSVLAKLSVTALLLAMTTAMLIGIFAFAMFSQGIITGVPM